MEMNIDTVNALNLKLNAVSDMYNTMHNNCVKLIEEAIAPTITLEVLELCMAHQTNLLIAMMQ